MPSVATDLGEVVAAGQRAEVVDADEELVVVELALRELGGQVLVRVHRVEHAVHERQRVHLGAAAELGDVDEPVRVHLVVCVEERAELGALGRADPQLLAELLHVLRRRLGVRVPTARSLGVRLVAAPLVVLPVVVVFLSRLVASSRR